MTNPSPQPMRFGPGGPLRGTTSVPGDKSISHRALMLSAMARGRSRIEGLSEGEDVLSTAAALQAMGVAICRESGGWEVDGAGTGCLRQPATALDMGNSGTSTRLLMGLVAGHPISAAFIGDASLSRRPMARVIDPLRRVGAEINASPGGRLPLMVRGCSPALSVSHRIEVASAQVKSALLLAGLNAPGVTQVTERIATRDHSERMLERFGADIQVEAASDGSRTMRLRGEAELKPQHILVPGDFSSAAFLIVAALIVPGSELRLERIGINPMRTGLLDALREMGADIAVTNPSELGGEPVADLLVRHSRLRAVDLPPQLAPLMIDEFPAFFIAAAFAEGQTRTRGLAELRIKESDRLAVMARGLVRIGVPVQESEDGLLISGSGGEPVPGAAEIWPELDHRIAMSFAIAGLHSGAAITIADMRPAATSYPEFAATLTELRAQ